LIIVDNYLAPDQLRKIREEYLWQQPLAGRYVIQDYYNLASETILFHHHAQGMFAMGAKKDPLLNKAYLAADGIEWWTHKFPNTYSGGHRTKLDWHFDKDEGLFKQGILRKPLAVAVLYIHGEEDVESMGKLEIKFGPGQKLIQEVDPKPNRCVIFDGSLEHRVTEGTNNAVRKSLAANLWLTRVRNKFMKV